MDATKSTALQLRRFESVQHVKGDSFCRLIVTRTNGTTFSIQPTPRIWYERLRHSSAEPETLSPLLTAVSTALPQTPQTEELRTTLRSCIVSVKRKRRPLTATTIRFLGVRDKQDMGPTATASATAAAWVLACRAVGIRIRTATTAAELELDADQLERNIATMEEQQDVLRTISDIEHSCGGSLPHVLAADSSVPDVPTTCLPLDEFAGDLF